MTTIYVVTEGSYSDYHIETLSSTKLAEEYVKLHKRRYDDFYIEEYNLDEFKSQVENRLSWFWVQISERGTVKEVRRESPSYERDYTNRFVNDWKSNPAKYYKLSLMTYCWAKDEGHAKKIANERRARILELNLWPKPSQYADSEFAKRHQEDIKELI